MPVGSDPCVTERAQDETAVQFSLLGFDGIEDFRGCFVVHRMIHVIVALLGSVARDFLYQDNAGVVDEVDAA